MAGLGTRGSHGGTIQPQGWLSKLVTPRYSRQPTLKYHEYRNAYRLLTFFFSAFWIQTVSDIHGTCPDLKASWHCKIGTCTAV